MNIASARLLLKSSTSGLILWLNNATASLMLSTHPDAFAPYIEISAGVQPIRPSPKMATFLAP